MKHKVLIQNSLKRLEKNMLKNYKMMMVNILMVFWDQQNIILVIVQHLEDMMKEIVEFLILMFSTIIMFKDMLELLNQIQELL